MAENAIREYAQSKGFHRQTLDRWLGWSAPDQDALERVAVSLRITENQLREMMDWLEEIALRDNATISEILMRPAIGSSYGDPRLGRADKVKRIKNQLRCWRFPRLAALEESIGLKIQALELPAGIQLNVPQGLEGGRLRVTFSAASVAEFEQMAHRLSDVASSVIIAEIFQTLSGGSPDRAPTQV